MGEDGKKDKILVRKSQRILANIYLALHMHHTVAWK